MTTIAAYVSAIAGLSVSGVNRQYDYKPISVQTADLPASFVELPEAGRDDTYATTCDGSGKTRTVELVVLLEAVNQSNPEPNYDATVAMMDALETALDGYRTSSDLLIDYGVTSGGRGLGDAFYWAAIANVTGTDL